MIEGRPFLYQDIGGTAYHVTKDGFQVIKGWYKRERIVAFVDGDKEGHQPAHFLMHSQNVQTILASSPKGALAGGMWTKQESSIMKLVTALWSPRELFIAGSVFGLLLSTLD
jgi:hypothetical protein